MTKGHRHNIRKAKEFGIFAYEDKNFNHYEDFILIYNETMKRNNALEYYFFSKNYFNDLRNLLGDRIKLFVAKKNDDIISASLFLITGEVIQYHLSGTSNKWLNYSSSKVIIDEVRKWGTSQGYKWFHLGGGLGSTRDSIFHFKSGFSKLNFSFEVMKSILEPQIYDKLIAQKKHWLEACGCEIASDNYFPIYCAPFKKKT